MRACRKGGLEYSSGEVLCRKKRFVGRGNPLIVKVACFGSYVSPNLHASLTNPLHPSSSVSTRMYNNNHNDQVVYAQFIGSVPTAPSDIYEYDFSIEQEADAAYSSHSSTNAPIAVAAPAGKIPPKNESESFADALNVSTQSPNAASHSKPVRPTATILSTTTTTTVSPPHPCHSLTGNELLLLMKKERKRRTLGTGILWGAAGFLILGPIGAVALGGGLAIATKQSLKRQERAIRKQLENEGTLDKPVDIPTGLSRRQRQPRR